MFRKWTGLALLLLIAALALGIASADEAENLTNRCKYASSGTKFKYTQMTDGKYTTYWYTHDAKHNWLQITAPHGEKIHGLYLCFKNVPDTYEIQTGGSDHWQTVAEGDASLYHAFYAIDGGASAVRVYVNGSQKQVLGFNEIFVFGEGEIPDWVQRWEPTPEKADILFLVTHPDDELIFMGGGIPTCVDEGYEVAVAYMTPSNTTRHSELLNGLWLMGLRRYPVIGPFGDSYQKSLDRQYKALGGEAKVNAWVAEVIRRLKPEVIVTQDADGEYGHPMHRVLSAAAQKVFGETADATKYPDSAERYGAWQARKLYVHLWPENASRFDWETPLEHFGGKTGLELADEAYALHVTQRTSGMSVRETGVTYDNHQFGLFASTVGPDIEGGDFFENIAGNDGAEPAVEVTELPEETEVGLTQIEEIPVETVTAEALPGEDTGETAAEETLPEEMPGAPDEDKAWVETDPDLAAILPTLNAKGYLDEGEFIWSSEEQGLYVYVGQTLKVVIRRTYERPEGKRPFHCFTADVWCDVERGMLPSAIFANPDKPRSAHDFIKNTAMANRVVFATSTDYYTYRIKQTYPTGIEVRGGQIFYDEPRRNPPTMPNYDTLAFFPDGHIESYPSTEMSAKQYVEAGAYDVYCFGPCLIRNGEYTDYVATANTSLNPRYAFGMVEPGHYVAILCEGRLWSTPRKSAGVQMAYLAKLLKEHGCQIAVNLDGGQTAVFCFMGRQINQVDKSIPYGRKQAEILGFGVSDQVGTYQIGP